MKNDHGKTTAFWVELVLSLTAMAVCGCICLVVFVKADNASKQSKAETQAMLALQTAVERFKVDPEGLGSIQDGEGSSSFFLTDDFVLIPDPGDTAVYSVNIHITEEDGLYQGEFTLSSIADKKEICSLTAKKYVSEWGSGS